jgi:hypothetical protein
LAPNGGAIAGAGGISGGSWEALPGRWQIGPVTYDPGALRADGYLGAFTVTAREPHPGPGKVPQTVTGRGEEETATLRDLDASLRGSKPADGSYLDDLRWRLRLAYVQGAEEWTREKVGRGMTDGELVVVVKRFAGFSGHGPAGRPRG